MRLTRKPFFPRPAASGPALPRILVRYLLGPDLSQQACQNQLRRPQLDLFQLVEFGRRACEECGLLGRGAAGGDALEGVLQHVVAVAPLSTGKLLSNIARSGPKAAMQVSIYGRQAAASSCELGGSSPK